jgi:hypothetical protein
MAASKHVAELVVNGVSMLRNKATLNNDIINEHINIFSSLCYPKLLYCWITNTNSLRWAIKALLKVCIPHLSNPTLSP